MIELIGRIVEVNANGITYRGRLVEIGETEINLESDLGWIVIPIEQVASINEIND